MSHSHDGSVKTSERASSAPDKIARDVRPSGAELQSRACGGDMEALSRLLTRTEARVKRYILKFMTSSHDTEDVLSDVWAEALLMAGKDPGALPLSEAELLPWLYRVAHNKCIDRLRRAERKANVASLDTPEGRTIVDAQTAKTSWDRSVEDAAIAHVDANMVQTSHTGLLAMLLAQPHIRLLLFLEVLEYHENNEQYGVYKEMAAQYGLTSATIANHISTMRRELKSKELADLFMTQTITLQALRIAIYRAINQKLQAAEAKQKRGRPRKDNSGAPSSVSP